MFIVRITVDSGDQDPLPAEKMWVFNEMWKARRLFEAAICFIDGLFQMIL